MLVLVLLSAQGWAQIYKKNLIACPGIRVELDSIQNNLDNLVVIFAKEIILEDHIGIEYSTDFTVCGQTGTVIRTEEKTSLNFIYDDNKYIGTGTDFERRFDLLYRELRLMLEETHYPTFRFNGADETNYEFCEKGKDAITSDKIVTVFLSKAPGFMKVSLTFTVKTKAKKAF